MSVVYINKDGNIVDKPTYSYSLNEKLGITTLINILRDKDDSDYVDKMDKINNAIDQDMHPSFLVLYIESMKLFDLNSFLWTAFKINRKSIAYNSTVLSEFGLDHTEKKYLVGNIPDAMSDWPDNFPAWG